MPKQLKGTVHLEFRQCNGKKVALLTMDNPPMNPLSAGVRTGLFNHLKTCTADPSVVAMVVTGANGAFCAGADISEFAGGMKGPDLVSLITEFEDSQKPVVAAIEGVALGGGCEIALGCHFRVAGPKAMMGLPEVNLGLLPGAGGTQRLPRLIGGEKAVELMCKGGPLNAKKAHAMGMLDELVASNAIDRAMELAVEQAGRDLSSRRLQRATGPSNVDWQKVRAQWAKVRRGENAPQAIINCVEAACNPELDFASGMGVEKKQFMKLFMDDQTKAMRYMFFAERACWKVPGLKAKPKPFKKVGVIGAGLMGGGIAMSCVEAGLQVVMIDAKAEFVAKGMAVIQKNYERSVKRGSMPQKKAEQCMANITNGGADYSYLSDCDIVIEAVYENMDIKKQVFSKLDKVCKPGAILATNTSYLSIDEIASATRRPEDVVGCHFFSPANVMKLLENVRGSKTSDATLATVMAFGKRINKICVLVNNCWGFVANRMMSKQGAVKLLENGCLPHEIDAGAEALGMRMGPMKMSDLVGLDLHAREKERNGTIDPQDCVTDWLYKNGHFGMKTGTGLYSYDQNRRASRNPEVETFMHQLWARKGLKPAKLSHSEIIKRIYFPVINEGFKLLEEGIVTKASDIDIALVYGYNWPRYTGGPMMYAELLGLSEVLKGIKDLGEVPSKLLVDMVENNGSLAKWSRAHEKKLLSKL